MLEVAVDVDHDRLAVAVVVLKGGDGGRGRGTDQNAGSAKEFFSTLLTTLIDTVEMLLVGALVASNAFIDGMLAVIENLIDTVMRLLTAVPQTETPSFHSGYRLEFTLWSGLKIFQRFDGYYDLTYNNVIRITTDQGGRLPHLRRGI